MQEFKNTVHKKTQFGGIYGLEKISRIMIGSKILMFNLTSYNILMWLTSEAWVHFEFKNWPCHVSDPKLTTAWHHNRYLWRKKERKNVCWWKKRRNSVWTWWARVTDQLNAGSRIWPLDRNCSTLDSELLSGDSPVAVCMQMNRNVRESWRPPSGQYIPRDQFVFRHPRIQTLSIPGVSYATPP